MQPDSRIKLVSTQKPLSFQTHPIPNQLYSQKNGFKREAQKKVYEEKVMIPPLPPKSQKIVVNPPKHQNLQLECAKTNALNVQSQKQIDLKQSMSLFLRNQMFQLIRREQGKVIMFDDDDQLIEEIKQNKQGKVQINLVAQRSQVKLRQQTVLPAICKITTEGGSRTGIDLICVIDISGSMRGQKIRLVQETMKVLIEALKPSDRLSIITFNQFGRRLCPLKAVTQQNMVILLNQVKGLKADGGTKIMAGMQLALKTIRDKKHTNRGTSIFLLSDGQDKSAELSLRDALKDEQNAGLGIFNIHSFGFGDDHDEDLMSHICSMRDGSFYYIQQLDTLDEAFCSALGGMISLVASEVNITVECVAKNLLSPVNISKVYESKWAKVGLNKYNIKLTQLMSEISKQFVFELTIPAIEAAVEDINREYLVIRALMDVKGVYGETYQKESLLFLTLINSNEEIAELNENVEVIESYLRVKAAAAIRESLSKAQSRKFQEAQKSISEAIQSIITNKKIRPQKLSSILDDLQKLKLKCSQQSFNQARKLMVSSELGFSNMTGLHFSNRVQTLMVQERKLKKSMQN